jgi:hypothetical protein
MVGEGYLLTGMVESHGPTCLLNHTPYFGSPVAEGAPQYIRKLPLACGGKVQASWDDSWIAKSDTACLDKVATRVMGKAWPSRVATPAAGSAMINTGLISRTEKKSSRHTRLSIGLQCPRGVCGSKLYEGLPRDMAEAVSAVRGFG